MGAEQTNSLLTYSKIAHPTVSAPNAILSPPAGLKPKGNPNLSEPYCVH